MFLSSNKCCFIKVLSVFFLILLGLLNLLSKLSSSGLKEVFKGIIRSLNINNGILDALVEGNNEGVVFVGSYVEVEFKIF